MTQVIVRNDCDMSLDLVESPHPLSQALDDAAMQVWFHVGRGEEYGYGCYLKLDSDRRITIVFWLFDDADPESALEAIRNEPVEL